MHNLETLLKHLSTETQAYIALANLPDLTLLPSFAKYNLKQRKLIRMSIQQWNKGMAEIAVPYNVNIVDLSSQKNQLTDAAYISEDGFHPGPAGYTQLANYFWLTINRSDG